MPGTPAPVGNRGPLGAWWAAILGGMERHSHRLLALETGATQGNLVDAAGNTIEVAGTNLAQVVTIGAVTGPSGNPGVQVGTNLTGGGRARQASLAKGTITTTAGSATATLNSTTSGTFAIGQTIGAADVSDPSSGVATPAIVPGTTISNLVGSTVTLSAAAAESGAAIYCAACNFTLLT